MHGVMRMLIGVIMKAVSLLLQQCKIPRTQANSFVSTALGPIDPDHEQHDLHRKDARRYIDFLVQRHFRQFLTTLTSMCNDPTSTSSPPAKHPLLLRVHAGALESV